VALDLGRHIEAIDLLLVGEVVAADVLDERRWGGHRRGGLALDRGQPLDAGQAGRTPASLADDQPPAIADAKGHERVERINYEICVLRALRERLRCKEIWVQGADRYRNPDEDLPQDFAERREAYYVARRTQEGLSKKGIIR
jgi:hypothetical protein